jgi:hypothetical protein
MDIISRTKKGINVELWRHYSIDVEYGYDQDNLFNLSFDITSGNNWYIMFNINVLSYGFCIRFNGNDTIKRNADEHENIEEV